MSSQQSTAPSDDALSVSTPLGTLDTAQTEPTPSSAHGPTGTTSVSAGHKHYVATFVDDVHKYIREQIRHADTKAVFFFGASTAILAFLHNFGASTRWLKPISTWNVVDTVTFVGMLALAIGALAAAWTVIPRLPGSRRGLLYFNAIAEHDSSAEYADEVQHATEQSLLNEKAKHCYILAGVCREKYTCLRTSLWLSIVGLAGAFTFLVMN